MTSFKSFAGPFQELLEKIISSQMLHTKWLNTLSYLENCGARKIAACEHPILVEEIMLKHASEEFRHAHYLKRQMGRLTPDPMLNYSLKHILGGTASWHYLKRLDHSTSVYLTEKSLPLKTLAYHLVTYAIEVRAKELYQIYDTLLRKCHSRITVRSILLEEEEHLQEMTTYLNQFENGKECIEEVQKMESALCQAWLKALEHEVNGNFKLT